MQVDADNTILNWCFVFEKKKQHEFHESSLEQNNET